MRLRRPHLLLVAVVGAALVLPQAAQGDGASVDRARSQAAVRTGEPPRAVTATGRYRLVTGDTAQVLTLADGTSIPTILGRTPYARFGTADGVYAVPRTAAPDMRELDLSLFDTTALARVTRHGRTPVLVRFAPRAAPRSVPGLRLDLRHSRAVGGSTVVHGSYAQDFRGLRSADLRGIASVRLDTRLVRAAAPSSRTPAPTHTVTVHVAHGDGQPADFAVVTLMNVVNSDKLLEQADVNALGIAKFHVPSGHYSVLVFTFNRVVLDPEFTVTADHTVDLDLADATVKPHAALAHHHARATDVSVGRTPDRGFAFPLSFSGPHVSIRLQPTSGRVQHGTLRSGLATTLAADRGTGAQGELAMTSDVVRGVPDDLTFVHHRHDFARVIDRFHANGPAGTRPLLLMSSDTRLDLSLGEIDVDAPVPGTRSLLLQAGPHAFYEQDLFPLTRSATSGDDTQMITLTHPRSSGRLGPLELMSGPVGPGLEVPPRFPAASGAVRRGDRLRLFVPLFSGAGDFTTFALSDRRDADWALRLGDRTLAHGHQYVAGEVRVPPGERRYVLTATSRPRPHSWQLSTRVSDEWRFHSRAGMRGVPLLTPSYVPPADLAGTARGGSTSFPLRFHSTARTARVAHASVDISTDDGRTWHPARVVRRSGDVFDVSYLTPHSRPGVRFLSLRVRAEDVHANSVVETAQRVVRLR